MLRFYGLEQRAWKRWEEASSQCKAKLTAQEIKPGDPGTILRDVETLIDFVGPAGIVTRGQNGTLPIERLPELNRKVSHPIELNLKRALLRDYPNLSGIFILLRVMGVLQTTGSRLGLCPSALQFWRRLNPTEQYFSLLGALLFHAQSSVLGGAQTREDPQAFDMALFLLGELSERWRNFDRYESASTFGPLGELPPWNLFVQQQLGLIEIRPLADSKRDPGGRGGRGWLVGAARLTGWGAAVTWALMEFRTQGEKQLEAKDNEEQESAEGEDELCDDESFETQFGALQPVFQPYFPEWTTVYRLPGKEVRLGVHTFKVTLGGWRGTGGRIWRRLRVPPDVSLDDLARSIVSAFKLDDDHAYDFRYHDQRGKNRVYHCPHMDEEPYTSGIAVAETELPLKGEMLFTFDYGDCWQFNVRLEAVDDSSSRLGQIEVIESAGELPRQYPSGEF